MTAIRWTTWRPLDARVGGKLIPASTSAYRPRCRGRVVRRALGRDREGVLDVGKSVQLHRGLAAFFRCATAGRDRDGHMAGWRYREVGLHRRYQPERLEVCWCTAKDGAEAPRLEADELE